MFRASLIKATTRSQHRITASAFSLKLRLLQTQTPAAQQQQQLQQQPRSPPVTTPVDKAFIITETIHSRKRIYSLNPQDSNSTSISSSQKLAYKWDDPITSSKNTSTSRPTHFLTSLETIVPHPVKQWFRQTFLPVGFPDSVHPVYTKVHILQFAETFLWSTVTVLCSQTMLESLGISSPAATGGAVAIQWVLKDQFGEIGKLIFINRFAKSLDSHPKTWKFVGEVASLSGAFMQLCTILNPSTAWFLTFASFGYMMRSIHFSIYNSTHMTFTRNFALQGNVGDIVAKDDSQQTIAHLCGLLTGISLLTFSHSPAFLFACFFLVGPIHYYATIAFLNATQFEVLSATKLLLLSDAYVNRNGVVLDYNTIEKEGNTVWFGEWIKKGWNGVKISKIGGSVEHVFGNDVANARDALEVLREEDYLIGYRKDTKSFGITFHQDVSVNDVMKAIVHVTKLNQRMRQIQEDSNVQLDMKALLRETLEWTRLEYPKFAVELEARGWLTDSVFWGDEGNRSTWDRGEKEYTASSGK